tara:strand:+ start:125 stop:286 length:162 start_codon:yes stop_codon:yes gene_type:complete
MSIKPVGWKPDGSHVSKGAIALIICFVIGMYCTYSDTPFGHPKVEKTPITKKK